MKEAIESNSQHSLGESNNNLIIGYYPIRGKAQVPRLLCQYLSVQYEDKLYELADMEKFRKETAKKWDFQDVPYLKEGNFIVTEAFPIAQYLIERFGDKDMLGRTQADRGIIQMYLWTIDTMGSIININCRKTTEQQIENFKKEQWEKAVLPRLMKYESFVKGDGWFLGYLSIIDFSIYELIRYMEMLFPGKTDPLKTLTRIKNMIYSLPQIKAYECSSRAIVEMDPSILMKRFKASKEKE